MSLDSVHVWCLVTKRNCQWWGRERERVGEEGERAWDSSSDLTTWGKPLQGHWSHTENTSQHTEEFHCLTDTNQSRSFDCEDYTDSALTQVKYGFTVHLLYVFTSSSRISHIGFSDCNYKCVANATIWISCVALVVWSHVCKGFVKGFTVV